MKSGPNHVGWPVTIQKGPYVGIDGTVVKDNGDRLRVAFKLFGRETDGSFQVADTNYLEVVPPLRLLVFSRALEELRLWLSSPDVGFSESREDLDDSEIGHLNDLGVSQPVCDFFRMVGQDRTGDDAVAFFEGYRLLRPSRVKDTAALTKSYDTEGRWDESWLPFLCSMTGQLICLVHEGYQTQSRVFSWWFDSGAHRIAPDFEIWISFLVEAISQGVVHWGGDDSGIAVSDESTYAFDNLQARFFRDYATGRLHIERT